MGILRIIVFVGLVTLTSQKSVKLMDIKESPELEAILQNIQNQGLYKDVKVKINPNKKTPDDPTQLQYLGEISSEKDGKEGLKSLNKKLAKLLDGLQDTVMNEKTGDPKCSCGYAGKRLPGVIKCQCGSLSDEETSTKAGERQKINTREELGVEAPIKTNLELRKIRSVQNKQERHIARLNTDNGYWSDDNYCGCKRLRRRDDDDDDLTLRCRCNSPLESTRAGKYEDRDEGYWSDDNWCGCKLLRSTGADKNSRQYLRCRCNSPARIGNNDDRDESYGRDDNRCGCNLIRTTGDDKDTTRYLRCGCSSPARVGKYDDRDESYESNSNRCGCKYIRTTDDDKDTTPYIRCGCNSPARVDKYDDRDEGYWSDDNWCGCRMLRNSDNDKDLTHYLRCSCDSPARVGEDDKDGGRWKADNLCGCKLLRDKGANKDLRCRCNSPSRAGHDMYSAPNGNNPKTDHFGALLSDLSEEDNNYQNKAKSKSNEYSHLDMLMSFILDKDENIDLSLLHKKDGKVLIKLSDIMPSLRNVNINELNDNIDMVSNENHPLGKNVYKQKHDQENLLTVRQIQTLLKLIDEQKTPTKNKKKIYRRSMSEGADGVPFTYEVKGLAQINL